jgi:phage FluMu protein gp41
MARTPKTHRYYRESNTALDECGVLTRPALLMVEGTVIDSTGQKTTYTRDLIDAIVEASNVYMQSNEIKLFNDHEYSQESRIGAVSGKFSAREITDIDTDDLELVGKYAIFNDGLEIRSEDAIEQYHSGLLKELSVGIDLKGSVFGKNVIYEVSAVPFPAVEAAHLYSKPMEEDTAKYAFTFESQLRRSQKEYTEDDMKSMDSRERGYIAFSRAMDNIIDATDDELPKSRYKSIKSTVSAFSDYLMGIYAPKPEEELKPLPIVMMEKEKMTEETIKYSAEDIALMHTKIAQLEKTNQDTLKFSALKDKASELVRNGKLSAAEYKAKFEGDQAFANYQAALNGDPLEGFLNYLDAHVTPDVRLAPSVYGATPLINQEVPQRPEADLQALKERAASIPVAKVSY